jgi:DNA-binding response OmpR family regulator
VSRAVHSGTASLAYPSSQVRALDTGPARPTCARPASRLDLEQGGTSGTASHSKANPCLRRPPATCSAGNAATRGSQIPVAWYLSGTSAEAGQCRRRQLPQFAPTLYGYLTSAYHPSATFPAVARARILVIDPDPQLSELLAHSLSRAGLSTVTARDAAAALDLFENAQPDLVVLGIDIGTPAGLEVLQTVCTQTQVILLGSVRREEKLIRGLDLGADDYLVKPFSFPELLARIRARLRRAAMQPTTPASTSPAPLQAGDLTLDPARGTVAYAGRPLRLTPTEFRVLEYLLHHAGAVVPTLSLLEAVWGHEPAVGPEVVRVNMHRLQHKLCDAGARNLLGTVRGVGFVVRAEQS